MRRSTGMWFMVVLLAFLCLRARHSPQEPGAELAPPPESAPAVAPTHPPTTKPTAAVPTPKPYRKLSASCMLNKLAHELTDPTSAPAKCRKFIGIIAPVTSRKQNITDIQETAYVKNLVPSILTTLKESEDIGLDFVLYLGYDKGDTLWDAAAAQAALVVALRSQVKAQGSAFGGSAPRIFLRQVQCESRNMVANSNCAIQETYSDGAEYWYRVNDDTELITSNWPRDFVNELKSFKPPNVGCVGPQVDKLLYLEYDFVHRTHWDILRFHYPPFIQNWWCDNWISTVYGPERTKLVMTQRIRHLRTGSRYKIYSGKPGKDIRSKLLPDELKKDACTIDSWLDSNGHKGTARTKQNHIAQRMDAKDPPYSCTNGMAG